MRARELHLLNLLNGQGLRGSGSPGPRATGPRSTGCSRACWWACRNPDREPPHPPMPSLLESPMRCPGCDTPLWKVRPCGAPPATAPSSRRTSASGPAPSASAARTASRAIWATGPRGCPPRAGSSACSAGASSTPTRWCWRWPRASPSTRLCPDTLPWVEAHRLWPVRWGLTAWLGVRRPGAAHAPHTPRPGRAPGSRLRERHARAGALAIPTLASRPPGAAPLPVISHAAAVARAPPALLRAHGRHAAPLVAWVALIVAAGRPTRRP